MIQSAAGAQMSEAVALDRPAVARLELGPTDTPAFLDISVPDATVEVTVTLPGGRVLSPRQPPARAGEWQKVEVLHGKSRDKADSFLLTMGAIMPIDGTHYVVGLEKVEPGLCEVHATRGKPGGGELRVAFLPLASIAAEHGRRVDPRERPAAGTVKIRARPLPFECSAGERLELVVSLSGDAGSEPPNFEAGIERRAKLRDTDVGIQYANPDPVQWRPAEMTRAADGSYHGWVTAPDPGMVRIAVRANGRTAAGKPFADEAIVTNEFLIVKPVVARFRSVKERAAGVRGSSQFDRLEVSAELEVIEPGEYMMTFTLRDSGGASLWGAAHPDRRNS